MGTNFYQIFVLLTSSHFFHSFRTFIPPFVLSYNNDVTRQVAKFITYVYLGKIRITLFHGSGITSNIKVHNHTPLRSPYVFAMNTRVFRLNEKYLKLHAG